MTRGEVKTQLVEYFIYHKDKLLSFKKAANIKELNQYLDEFDKEHLFICKVRNEHKEILFILAIVYEGVCVSLIMQIILMY